MMCDSLMVTCDPSVFKLRTLSMTLRTHRDIGGTPNLFASVAEILDAFSNPVGHVVDGVFSGTSLTKDELPGLACGLTACRSIYITEPHGTGPIAGFLINETLGRAQLAFLIDNEPAGTEIPRATALELGGFMNSLFKAQQIDSVGIPGDHAIQPLFGQTIDRGPTTVVSLAAGRDDLPETQKA